MTDRTTITNDACAEAAAALMFAAYENEGEDSGSANDDIEELLAMAALGQTGVVVESVTGMEGTEMSATFGELTGRLTLEIGGQKVDLGNIRVPVVGYADGCIVRLTADLYAVREAVESLSMTYSKEDA